MMCEGDELPSEDGKIQDNQVQSQNQKSEMQG